MLADFITVCKLSQMKKGERFALATTEGIKVFELVRIEKSKKETISGNTCKTMIIDELGGQDDKP